MHSGLRHLKILSSRGSIDTKWQNDKRHDTKSLTPAAIIAAFCRLQSKILNLVGGDTRWSTDIRNSQSHCNKQSTRVLQSPNITSTFCIIHELQIIWPFSHVEPGLFASVFSTESSAIYIKIKIAHETFLWHSFSKQHWHLSNSFFALSSLNSCSSFAFTSSRYFLSSAWCCIKAHSWRNGISSVRVGSL